MKCMKTERNPSNALWQIFYKLHSVQPIHPIMWDGLIIQRHLLTISEHRATSAALNMSTARVPAGSIFDDIHNYPLCLADDHFPSPLLSALLAAAAFSTTFSSCLCVSLALSLPFSLARILLAYIARTMVKRGFKRDKLRQDDIRSLCVRHFSCNDNFINSVNPASTIVNFANDFPGVLHIEL